MIYIYILLMADKRYYTGITKNIVNRLLQHQNGKSKSTKKYLPVVLKHIETTDTYKHARQTEKHIKNIGAKNYLTRKKMSINYKMIH